MLPDYEQVTHRHGNLRLPWRTGLLVAIASMLYLLAGPMPEQLVYSRTDIINGDWWRLITGHWVHSDTQHALWDITALAVLGGYSERYLGKRVFTYLLSASLFISACIWILLPWLEYYCGLSGILHTLLVIGMTANWGRQRDPVFLIITGLTALKTAVEIYSNSAIFTDTIWPSLPQAHLYGMILGSLMLAANILILPRFKLQVHHE